MNKHEVLQFALSPLGVISYVGAGVFGKQLLNG